MRMGHLLRIAATRQSELTASRCGARLAAHDSTNRSRITGPNRVNEQSPDKVRTGRELAGSRPHFAAATASDFATAQPLSEFRRRRLLFNRVARPGQIHVYSANCRAGERIRAQLFVPVLPLGGALIPAFAIVGQSLPYSADVQRLPLDLPAGFSAVVAPPPSELTMPVQDMLTGVQYYPGPSIDTRSLVSGRCYLVVWSPQNQMGKYVVQTGYSWPWQWSYWLQVPRFWWQIRGWFGLGRQVAYIAAALVIFVALLIWNRFRGRER